MRKVQGLAGALRIMRATSGLSQQEAAYIVGTSQILWSLWECGKVRPRKKFLQRLGRLLAFDPRKLNETLAFYCQYRGLLEQGRENCKTGNTPREGARD
jgi:transcriptional regulator with XRE-family HTH domain